MERGENIPATISDNLKEIRAYREQHSELQKSHHFLYAVPWKHERDYATVKYNVLVISMHPGESCDDKKLCPAPAEESMESDFHDKEFNGKRAEHDWVIKGREYLGFEMPVLETAFFFWSSRGTKKFKEWFGYGYGTHAHLQRWKWCKKMNLALIDAIKPKLKVAMGMTCAREKLIPIYGLHKNSSDVLRHNKNYLLIPCVLCCDKKKIPFVFIPHPKAPVSKQNKNKIKQYLGLRVNKLGLA